MSSESWQLAGPFPGGAACPKLSSVTRSKLGATEHFSLSDNARNRFGRVRHPRLRRQHATRRLVGFHDEKPAVMRGACGQCRAVDRRGRPGASRPLSLCSSAARPPLPTTLGKPVGAGANRTCPARLPTLPTGSATALSFSFSTAPLGQPARGRPSTRTRASKTILARTAVKLELTQRILLFKAPYGHTKDAATKQENRPNHTRTGPTPRRQGKLPEHRRDHDGRSE